MNELIYDLWGRIGESKTRNSRIQWKYQDEWIRLIQDIERAIEEAEKRQRDVPQITKNAE